MTINIKKLNEDIDREFTRQRAMQLVELFTESLSHKYPSVFKNEFERVQLWNDNSFNFNIFAAKPYIPIIIYEIEQWIDKKPIYCSTDTDYFYISINLPQYETSEQALEEIKNKLNYIESILDEKLSKYLQNTPFYIEHLDDIIDLGNKFVDEVVQKLPELYQKDNDVSLAFNTDTDPKGNNSILLLIRNLDSTYNTYSTPTDIFKQFKIKPLKDVDCCYTTFFITLHADGSLPQLQRTLDDLMKVLIGTKQLQLDYIKVAEAEKEARKQLLQQRARQLAEKIKWTANSDYMRCSYKDILDKFHSDGRTVHIYIMRSDEWETEENYSFENALWFPFVEPDIHDEGEGNEISLAPGNADNCSLQDCLKAVTNNDIKSPSWDVLYKFLQKMEAQFKTGTLEEYLKKYENELKSLCDK